MRHRAFLKTKEAAELLDVNHRTLLNWEKGKSRIPYTAYRILKLKVGYVFDDQHFGDWFVKGDTLWSPEGRGFKPDELHYIANYFWMARQWLAERMAGRAENPLDVTIPTGAASDGSPTSPAGAVEVGTLPSCGAAPLREPAAGRDTSYVRQEKHPEFERFMAKLGIPA
jgi:DNA-binding XRE family transcriptional regulator